MNVVTGILADEEIFCQIVLAPILCYVPQFVLVLALKGQVFTLSGPHLMLGAVFCPSLALKGQALFFFGTYLMLCPPLL